MAGSQEKQVARLPAVTCTNNPNLPFPSRGVFIQAGWRCVVPAPDILAASSPPCSASLRASHDVPGWCSGLVWIWVFLWADCFRCDLGFSLGRLLLFLATSGTVENTLLHGTMKTLKASMNTLKACLEMMQ